MLYRPEQPRPRRDPSRLTSLEIVVLSVIAVFILSGLGTALAIVILGTTP